MKVLGLRFKDRLYALFLIIPFISQVKNKHSFILSLLLLSNCTLVLSDNIRYRIPVYDYYLIRCVLALKQYSSVYDYSNGYVVVSFDGVNKFKIRARSLSREDQILVILLADGVRDGAIFIEGYKKIQAQSAIYIVQEAPSRIITSEGITFRLDAINPGGIIETFVRRIHQPYLTEGLVIDVGASFGDTPLYFAANGAKVYAIEMTSGNFDLMLKNLGLNPSLAKNIIPIWAAIGKDQTITYGVDGLKRIQTMGGATFVTNKYGEDSKIERVQGITLSSLVKRFGIDSIDLLKTDCKGCEFFLKNDDMKNVKKIKIEYYTLVRDHNVDSLLKILHGLGYQTLMYKHTPSDTTSMLKHGNIIATR